MNNDEGGYTMPKEISDELLKDIDEGVVAYQAKYTFDKQGRLVNKETVKLHNVDLTTT